MTSWAWFLVVLRTKEAHKRYQFRARSYKERKMHFWQDLINIYKRIFLH